MAATKFRLRGNRIHLDFHYGQSQRFRYPTGLKILKAKNWDSAKMRVRNVAEEKFKTQVNNQLNKFTSKLEEEYTRLSTIEGIEVTEDLLKLFSDRFFNRIKEPQAKKKIELLEYYDWYIENFKTRPLPTTGEPLKKGTAKTYRNSYNIIKRFNDAVYPLTFENITLSFYEDFLKWLYEQEYSANYTGTQIKNLKTILQSALEKELHSNRDFTKKYFRKPIENVDNIFLTQDEINRIKNLDLSNFQPIIRNKRLKITREMMEKARDLFLIGCVTGLRVSDYTRLKRSDIFSPDGDNHYLRIITTKGKKPVTIPLNSTARDILAKNNGNPPKRIPEQHINYCLKILGELAEIDEQTGKTVTRGGKPQTITEPKYNLIVNHTARRTFCTLAYLSQMPTADIMAISQHASEKVFYNYIKVNDLQKAVKIGKHKFFQ